MLFTYRVCNLMLFKLVLVHFHLNIHGLQNTSTLIVCIRDLPLLYGIEFAFGALHVDICLLRLGCVYLSDVFEEIVDLFLMYTEQKRKVY